VALHEADDDHRGEAVAVGALLLLGHVARCAEARADRRARRRRRRGAAPGRGAVPRGRKGAAALGPVGEVALGAGRCARRVLRDPARRRGAPAGWLRRGRAGRRRDRPAGAEARRDGVAVGQGIRALLARDPERRARRRRARERGRAVGGGLAGRTTAVVARARVVSAGSARIVLCATAAATRAGPSDASPAPGGRASRGARDDEHRGQGEHAGAARSEHRDSMRRADSARASPDHGTNFVTCAPASVATTSTTAPCASAASAVRVPSPAPLAP